MKPAFQEGDKARADGTVSISSYDKVESSFQLRITARERGLDRGRLEYDASLGGITGYVSDRPIASENSLSGSVVVSAGGTYLLPARAGRAAWAVASVRFGQLIVGIRWSGSGVGLSAWVVLEFSRWRKTSTLRSSQGTAKAVQTSDRRTSPLCVDGQCTTTYGKSEWLLDEGDGLFLCYRAIKLSPSDS